MRINVYVQIKKEEPLAPSSSCLPLHLPRFMVSNSYHYEVVIDYVATTFNNSVYKGSQDQVPWQQPKEKTKAVCLRSLCYYIKDKCNSTGDTVCIKDED